MSQAPGIQMQGFDVGGSHAGTQTGYVTYGMNVQNQTKIEGIDQTEGTDANAGALGFVGAVPDLKQKTTAGGILYVFSLPGR